MQGKLSLTTLAHILAASLSIHKSIVEKLKVRHVETNEYKVVPAVGLPSLPPQRTMVHNDSSTYLLPFDACSSAFYLPLQEIDILLNNSLRIPTILNTGLQITVIWHNIMQLLGVPINYQCLIEMEGANSATNWTVGYAEDLIMQVSDVSLKVHTHIVEQASFGLLLG